MTNTHKAIGVIDSGSRPDEEVCRFGFEMIKFLQHQEIRMVVVACNSANAAGLSYPDSYRPFIT